MKKTKPNRILVPFLLLIAFAVVAADSWLAVKSVNSLISSEYWVDHSWQAINQVERIMGSAKDAETGNRGFLITGDDRYLEPYTAARRDLPAELDRLQELIRDNPPEMANLQIMRSIIDQRLALLEEGIALHREGLVDSSHASASYPARSQAAQGGRS